MNQIKVQHFGPIQEGFTADSGWMKMPRVTAFCGPQGSGKSSVVKAYAFFVWLEKKLVSGEMTADRWQADGYFVSRFGDYYGVTDYFRPDTVLAFRGESYDFEWSGGRLNIKRLSSSAATADGYLPPKVMYIPAERNFMSVIERADRLRNIPGTLDSMISVFRKALDEFSAGIDLPLPGFSVVYDQLNKRPKINVGTGTVIRLSAASGGLQSVTPMFLVCEYIYRTLKQKTKSTASISPADRERMISEARSLLKDGAVSDVVRSVLAQVNALRYRRFINIVEEPEQNLFPTSQEKMLRRLLRYAVGDREVPDNQLVLTTHSPYVINYLILVAQAYETQLRMRNHADVCTELPAGMTEAMLVSPEEMCLYETTADGRIQRIVSDDGFPSDRNTLNDALMRFNSTYADLLDLGDACGCD